MRRLGWEKSPELPRGIIAPEQEQFMDIDRLLPFLKHAFTEGFIWLWTRRRQDQFAV